jgi:hypothetical protein
MHEPVSHACVNVSPCARYLLFDDRFRKSSFFILAKSVVECNKSRCTGQFINMYIIYCFKRAFEYIHNICKYYLNLRLSLFYRPKMPEGLSRVGFPQRCDFTLEEIHRRKISRYCAGGSLPHPWAYSRRKRFGSGRHILHRRVLSDAPLTNGIRQIWREEAVAIKCDPHQHQLSR